MSYVKQLAPTLSWLVTSLSQIGGGRIVPSQLVSCNVAPGVMNAIANPKINAISPAMISRFLVIFMVPLPFVFVSCGEFKRRISSPAGVAAGANVLAVNLLPTEQHPLHPLTGAQFIPRVETLPCPTRAFHSTIRLNAGRRANASKMFN